jgi:hypothetical protein
MTHTSKSNTSNKQPERQRQIIKRVILASIIFVAVFGVYELGRQYHYWGEPNELRVIKSENITKTDLLNLTLIESMQHGEGDLVKKTVSPSVTRTFQATNNDIERTKEKIIQYAENDGWKHDPTLEVNDEWWGRKTVGRFELTLIVGTSLRFNDAIKIEVF